MHHSIPVIKWVIACSRSWISPIFHFYNWLSNTFCKAVRGSEPGMLDLYKQMWHSSYKLHVLVAERHCYLLFFERANWKQWLPDKERKPAWNRNPCSPVCFFWLKLVLDTIPYTRLVHPCQMGRGQRRECPFLDRWTNHCFLVLNKFKLVWI